MKSYKLANIGFLVFSAILIFFYGLRFLQNESLQKSTFSFKVIFNNSQGIDISDDVRMLGKKIGRITGTEIIGQNIAVKLTVDNSYSFKIPIDSDIEITQSDLMGSKFISIYPGNDKENFILPDETILGISTEVASLTEDVSRFAKKINDTYGQKQKEQVKNTINNIESASNQIDSFITKNLNFITEEDKEHLHSLLLNIDTASLYLSELLNEESKNIKESIQNFNLTMKKIPSLSEDLNTVVLDLKDIIQKINNNQGTLGKIINDDSLYGNLNNLVLDANLLINDINNNPTRWLRAYFAAKREEKNN
tara:strand:+ start:7464 stop:8387 length:924 start_codon:yes stop_codon:yes gene_type:complete